MQAKNGGNRCEKQYNSQSAQSIKRILQLYWLSIQVNLKASVVTICISNVELIMSRLSTLPVTNLKGVGAKVAEKLEKLAIKTVQDLLFHLPSRYEDRTRVCAIANLVPNTHVRIIGEVVSSDIKYGRRRMLLVKLKDETGVLTLRFFHFSNAQMKSLANGQRVSCFGEARRGVNGIEMMHPEYQLVSSNDAIILEDTLTPVYPATDGIKQLTLRKLVEQALRELQQFGINELLPDGLYPNQISMQDALTLLHSPPATVSPQNLEDGQHPAQQRLIIEELLAHSLSIQKLRHQSDKNSSLAITINDSIIQQFLSQLPFKPTNAQQRVTAEIQQDMGKTQPMMRLVQGDVGSGKTLVAVLAALSAMSSGVQVALMAPTELLAEQHMLNMKSWLEPLGFKVGWLAGKLKAKPRKTLLQELVSGDINLLVGTHAIFQETVDYHRLGLVIVDEQHRFGVHQRLALRQKGEQAGFYPHQLIMTATPIPRTLAMTAYADLNVSVIDELPPGRTPVKTVALPDTRRADIIERIRHQVTQQKRQVYWVCTLIEESDVLECQAAEDACTGLKTLLPELSIGLVHGRLKSDEKQAVMSDFKGKSLDVLVATTVIEVGVDVPNASLMVIENPERLGLAQLHQLRGRVGRGKVESHCVLLYQAPLSKTATKRLGVMRESNDGFVIAQKDLEIRGPGELLGTKQTGLADLKIADLVRDQSLIPQVKLMAERVWQYHPSAAQAILNRWLPYREHYSHA